MKTELMRRVVNHERSGQGSHAAHEEGGDEQMDEDDAREEDDRHPDHDGRMQAHMPSTKEGKSRMHDWKFNAGHGAAAGGCYRVAVQGIP